MEGQSIQATKDCKHRLQKHLIDKVVLRISGRDGSDIIRSPSRSLFAGVLRPRFRRSESQEIMLEKQQTSSIGFDFRLRPVNSDAVVSLQIRVRWAFYYAVFPSWQITKRDNVVLKKDGSNGAHSEILLPITFRRKEVSGRTLNISLNGDNAVAEVCKYQKDITAAQDEIDHDQDRWCHLGDPEKNVRTLGTSESIINEHAYQEKLDSFRKTNNRQKLPDWEVSLYCEGSEDIVNPDLHRIKVLLSNDTLAFDDSVKDRALDERSIFDAYLEVEVINGEVVPFEFLLAEKDYRSVPRMIAKGINCVVKGSSSRAVLLTDTLPIYEQPLYRARVESEIRFESLDIGSPEESLSTIIDAMTLYGTEWDNYLAGEAKSELTKEELLQCREDRKKFGSEISSFLLGIECLKRDNMLKRAFRLMNRVFYRLGQKSGGKIQAWRLFQLCFIVIQMPSLFVREMDDSHETEFKDAVIQSFNRASVLWFPTGGGKTEAYLGLIATALLFDRLRGKTRGLSTWMRFPLRMLSLQQMERLAKVIAELNIIRQEEAEVANGDPFSIGYYVGRTVTPNAISERDMAYLESKEEHRRRLLLLRKCPYCGSAVDISIDRKSWRILHKCESNICFSNTSKSLGVMRGSLPLFVVDKEIYRYLPSVLVGTVDKLAIAGFNIGFSHLIRGSTQRCPDHGYTSYDECLEVYSARCKHNKKKSLESLEPVKDPGPALLLQDELHLLKSDLGVFNGHYEGLLQYLGSKVYLPPKVLAATATIESYDHHAFHLYLKNADRFPEPSWKKGESFYATSSPLQVRRKYVGILCHTNAIDDAAARVIYLYQHEIRLLRANLTESRAILDATDLTNDQLADLIRLYDLSLAYVNRKATGSTLLYKLGLSNSMLNYEGMTELSFDLLTGDRTPDDIGATIERIESERDNTGEARLDVVAATSLISHGVDIERINMMTICGMPSHYAEYIQSSSRSARSHPGIVFSCFLSKDVRELSQYEMFYPMHENMDALIEPVAVNRFATFAPSKTMPGLLAALLINGLGPQLYKRGVAKPLIHVPTVKVALGLSSTGSSGTQHCIKDDELLKALLEIIGADRDWERVSKKEVSNIRDRISEILNDLIALIGRTPEKRLPDVLKPITSFRDVDQGLEFTSSESASLVTRMSGR